MTPPRDRERAPIRVSLTSAILVGLAGSALSAAVTWGKASERIDTLVQTVAALNKQNTELRELVLIHDRQITELRAFSPEIIRRLERIEKKIDEQEVRRR
jgi:hypothetical protein